MAEISIDTHNLTLAFDELTEEMNDIIGQEVHTFFGLLKKKGWDVRDTHFFFRSITAPIKKSKWEWQIQLKAKYSTILWNGRRKVGGRYYGSKKWSGGGEPMLRKLENDIIRRTDNVQR